MDIHVSATDKQQTLLSLMRANGVTAYSECESGFCGACRVRLVSGEVAHSDAAIAFFEPSNQALACCSRPLTPTVTVRLI